MATIGKLNYQITANTSGFTKGVTATRKELAAAKRIMRETQTPAEKLGAKINETGNLFRKGAISQDVYTRRMKEIKAAHREAKPVIEKTAKVIKEVNRTFKATKPPTPAVGKFSGVLSKLHPALIATAVATAGVAAAMMIARRAIRIMTTAVKEQLAEIDKIAKSARTIGIASEELIGLRMAAAEFSGMSGDQMDNALKQMNVGLGEAARGTGEAKQALDMLGISAEQIKGQSPATTFKQIADSIKAIEDPTQRAYAAQKIFGGGGNDLINTLAAGSEGLAAVQREAERLGGTLTELDAAKVEFANDMIARMKMSFAGLARSAAIELAPSIAAVAQMMTELMVNARSMFSTMDAGFGDLQNDISGMTEVVAVAFDWLHALKLVGQAYMIIRKISNDLATGRAFTSPIESMRETNAMAAEFMSDLAGESWGEEIRRRAEENGRKLKDALADGMGGGADTGPDPAIDKQLKLNDSAQSLADKLRDQVRYAGMAGNQTEIMKLKLQGADQELIKQAQHWDQIIERQERANATRTAVTGYVDQLAGEARATRLNADQLKLYELAQKGASQFTLMRIAVIQKHVREMQRLKKMREDAKSLVEEMKTPEQKYADTVRKLTEMLRRNMLTLGQFTKLKRDAAKELEKPITINLGSVGIQGARAGSKEAMLRLQGDRQRLAAAAAAARERGGQKNKTLAIDAAVAAEANRTTRTSEGEIWERMAINLDIIANAPPLVIEEAGV